MRTALVFSAVVGAALLGSAGCRPVEAAVPEASGPLSATGRLATQEALHAATVTLEDRCAGVVVEDRLHVVTAAHCIEPGERSVSVAYVDGSSAEAAVEVVDRTTDVAVLSLKEQAPVAGLEISAKLPGPGTEGFFAGRADRGTELQDVSVERLGPCPSLPGVPAALFTTVDGVPGDSGAPLVDRDFKVVGLIHGGARCNVAAPTHAVPEMLATLSPDDAPAARAEASGASAAEAPEAEKTPGTRRGAARRGPASR